MFSSTPEYVQAVFNERERETQLVLQVRAAEQMTQDERPRKVTRAWTQFVTVRVPRSLRVWSAGRA
jgi:hypothetical protein